MMPKQSLLKGTLILTISSLFIKIIGFVNGIVMSRTLGSEGIGLIMMAMPGIGLILTLTTLGLPVAISKVVAELDSKNDHRGIVKTMTISLTLTTALSVLLSIAAFFGSKIYASYFLTDQRAYYALIAFIPMIPIIGIAAVIKGYFRGKQNMTPIAVSDVVEQIIHAALLYTVMMHLMPYGVKIAAVGAILCSITGEAVSLLYLLFRINREKIKKQERKKPFSQSNEKGKGIFLDLLRTGIPTTTNEFIHSVINIFEPVIITQSLAVSGVASSVATKQYGELLGYAFPLLFLPTFILHSLSISLVPSVSEANAKNNTAVIHRQINQALRLALIVGVPWTIIAYLFATNLTTVIYHSPEAGVYLKIMAPFFLLHYFQIPLESILIGLGKANIALINDVLPTIVSLASIYWLASNPELGIKGVALAFSASVILGTALNFLTVSKLVGFNLYISDLVKVILAGIVMGFGAITSYQYFGGQYSSPYLPLILTLSISLMIYLLLLYSFRVLNFKRV
ncbi:stage V sporulation protein B [Scopulibacillus darangshiensis]|uniref:Stage V sporulation protein B n=1 Tax=Scopulibacillus darangshiensis TaxID=442528 RepID=A0A4V2SNH9_9BACL|nr:stage V sporulation protein B [Scopulibacillus darangshiensis]TCP31306.1 stage V sporulation protein B [Scopulibacillus darangshiensis]